MLDLSTVIERDTTAMPRHEARDIGTRVLAHLFRYRRLPRAATPCRAEPCQRCFLGQLARAERSIAAWEPILFVLPGFPAKSPNPRKVLGHLPDLAEELALSFLQRMLFDIAAIYPPGARIILCSDGRVFSDLVCVTDDKVSEYSRELGALIERLGASGLSRFSLDDAFPGSSFGTMWDELVRFLEPIERIRDRARSDPEGRTLFCGIQRFLFEDRVVLEPKKSRSRVRTECKHLALRLIQRSQGWSRLIAQRFPNAIRLSIHPQDPHAAKIGILLSPAADVWLTPWHGVAVEDRGRFALVRRFEAEAMGARIVERHGRASHFEVIS